MIKKYMLEGVQCTALSIGFIIMILLAALKGHLPTYNGFLMRY